MMFPPENFKVDLGVPVELSAPMRAQLDHVGLVAPAISSNYPLDQMLPEYNQTVAIDESALYDGIEAIDLTLPTKVILHSDWQDSLSKSEVLRVEPTAGYYETTADRSGLLFTPTEPYIATIKLGVQPNEAKNEKQANRAFWTGVLACRDMIHPGANLFLDLEIADANKRAQRIGQLIMPASILVFSVVNPIIRDQLGVTTDDYKELLEIMVGTAVVIAPSFVAIKASYDKLPKKTATDVLTKKYAKQARKLASEFPVVQIEATE